LTLPVARTVELFHEDGQLDTIYRYRYSDHKAFTVDTNVNFGLIENPSNLELNETEDQTTWKLLPIKLLL